MLQPKRTKYRKQQKGRNRGLQVWSRSSVIMPEFVGATLMVHNGKIFVPVLVNENMVGHKVGEFSMTRTFRGHSGDKKTAAPAAKQSDK